MGEEELSCSSPGVVPEADGASLAGACGEALSDHRCELGEGLFVSGSLTAWLDIAADRLYLCQGSLVSVIDLPVKATVILEYVDKALIVASAEGLARIAVPNGSYERRQDGVAELCAGAFRTNDGCRLSGGSYLVGTMHTSAPDDNPGAVFLLNGSVVQSVIEQISIPNLFVELPDGGLLIADSLRGTIYRCYFDQAGKHLELTPWYQAEAGISPDGGCLLPDGRVAVAMWGGACVRLFEPDGSVFRELPVAAKCPTNVKYDGSQDRILVTSAREGLADEQLQRYPMSGATFSIPCSMLR